MKKRALQILFGLVLAWMSPQFLHAYNDGDTIHYNGSVYVVLSKTESTVALVGSSITNLVVPTTVPTRDQTFTVTTIGNAIAATGLGSVAPVTFAGVQTISIPETVTTFSSTLSGATITTITLPKSLKSFSGLTGVTTIKEIRVDPANPYFDSYDGILYTENYKTLIQCPRAKEFPNNSLTIQNADTIACGAFHLVAGLKILNLPATVKYFQKLPDFRNVIYASGITEINVDPANPYFTSVDGVVLSKDEKTLALYPLRKNAAGRYTVPATVERIDTFAFNAAQIRYIDLSNVKRIGYMTFYQSQLREVTIPKSLERMEDAFCISLLNKITVEEGSKYFKMVDNALYTYSGKTLVMYPVADATVRKLEIPAGTDSIGGGAFWYASYLDSLIIPKSLTYIGTVRGLPSGSTVIFEPGSKLKEIKLQAFYGSGFKSITLPASLEKIGDAAFVYCQLDTVNIEAGSKLKVIERAAFGSCTSLKAFNFLGSCTLDSIGREVFVGDSLSSFNFPASVRVISERAFADIKTLSTITFADDAVAMLDTIHSSAFSKTGITLERIPASVRYIGPEAFWNVKTSPTLALSSRINNISPEAFKGCYTLTHLNVDKANTTYSSIDGMLLTKDKETLVLFPPGKANTNFTLMAPSIRKIGDYAFYENERLTNVVIPNRVTSLGKRSFGLCPNLNSITLLCEKFLDPANIKQLLNESSFDDGVTTQDAIFGNIDLHVRKDLLSQYQNEPFYLQFKSINTSFNPLLRPGQSNDKNTLEEYIAVSADAVSLIKANNTEDETYVVPETVNSTRTKKYKVAMVGDYAFHGCGSNFNEVVLPNAVSYVGAKAFLSDTTNVTTSSVKSIFLLDATASAETFSTTRFELDDTGNDYSEFARNTKVYVKKSAFTSTDFQNAMKRYTTRVPMPNNPSQTLRPATPQMFQYKVPGITLNNTYGTFAREFDVDLAEYAKEIGEDIHVVAFTSPRDEPGSYFKPAGPDGQGGDGDQKAKYYVRMTSLKHTMADGTEVDGTYVPANTGVLLKVMTGGPVTDEDYFYCIGEDGRAAQPAASYLVGVTRKDTVLNDTGRDIFGMQKGVFQPLNGATGVTFPAHKAYLKLSGFPGATGNNTAGAKVMFLFGDSPVPTEIDAFGMDEGMGMKDESPVYDLQGRRVSAPTKGIYVRNGKKVIIK